jgi:hypothetical protein
LHVGKKRNAYRILMGKFEGKRALERRRRRNKDDIKTNPKGVGLKKVGLI